MVGDSKTCSSWYVSCGFPGENEIGYPLQSRNAEGIPWIVIIIPRIDLRAHLLAIDTQPGELEIGQPPRALLHPRNVFMSLHARAFRGRQSELFSVLWIETFVEIDRLALFLHAVL